MTIRDVTDDFVMEAIGRSHRDDAVLEHSGGPAGNARLTAWTGLILLLLFLGELVTLLDVRGLLNWHVAVGVLLIPPALLKTASTGWRIARYYVGSAVYRAAGPPPLLLRLLGPLVVISTLAVLGSGIALILVNPQAGERATIGLGGFAIDMLFIHKATFVIWGAAAGVHTLGRIIPAVRLTVVPAVRQRIPGGLWRTATLSTTIAIAVLTAVLALSLVAPWQATHTKDGPDRGRHTTAGHPR